MPAMSKRPRNYNNRGLPPRKRYAMKVVQMAGRALKVAMVNRGKAKGKSKTKSKRKNVSKDTSDQTGLKRINLGSVSLGRPMKHPKPLATYQFRNINNWVVDGIVGEQVVDFIEAINTRNQLFGVKSNDRNNRFAWPDNPFELNPFHNIPTSTLYPSGAGVPNNDVLHIKNVQVELGFLSMTTIPQTVTIYMCTPKFDTDKTPLDHWVAVLAAKSLGAPTSTASNAISNATAQSGALTVNGWGVVPTHEREFTKCWSVLKKKEIVLQAGEQIDMMLRIQLEKIVHRTSLEERSGQFLAGLTVFPMIVSKAGLVGIGAFGAPAVEVTYGAPKVGVLHNYKVTFGALPRSRISVSRIYAGQLVNDITDEKKIINDQDQATIPSEI